MALALAHALEYPGKRRLDRDTYFKVQAIYYPGFTIGGAGEPLAPITVFAPLLSSATAGSTRISRAVLALLSLIALVALAVRPA